MITTNTIQTLLFKVGNYIFTTVKITKLNTINLNPTS